MNRYTTKNAIHAYAMTYHKSQGSEWDYVITICNSKHRNMLNRNLLYTGITRAKKKAFIIGDDYGVLKAVETVKVFGRKTWIQKLHGII